MNRKRYVVSFDRSQEQWKVAQWNAARPAAVAPTKADAIARGRELAKNARLGQLFIKNKNGVIATEYTYGDDPRKYRG